MLTIDGAVLPATRMLYVFIKCTMSIPNSEYVESS